MTTGRSIQTSQSRGKRLTAVSLPDIAVVCACKRQRDQCAGWAQQAC